MRYRKLTADAPVGNWTWRRAAPQTWKPTYAERGTARKIVLHIYSPFYGDEIYRATDTYPAGSYDCKTRTMVLCGGGGYLLLTDVPPRALSSMDAPLIASGFGD